MLQDISSLRFVSDLTFVAFEGTSFTSSFGRSFPNLMKLCLYEAHFLTDISCLGNCISLVYVELNGCPLITDITMLTTVETLILHDCEHIKRVNPFRY
jgi:hypothetical protein